MYELPVEPDSAPESPYELEAGSEAASEAVVELETNLALETKL